MRYSHEERQIELLERILRQLRILTKDIEDDSPQVSDFTLQQIEQGELMAINGTPLGGTSTFQIGLVPSVNFVPLTSGPTVTVDDANVTLGPVDPKTLQFTAAVAATDTATSYNLTITGVNGATPPATITHSFNVPITAAPPTQVTDFSLSQLS